MENQLNPLVDQYLLDGCMRCKYGATPQCKVLRWTEILEHLRQIALESDLKEEIKWGVPVYTYKEKNILTVSALKDCALLGFFKGALLKDEAGILEQQGNIQSSRIIRFQQLEKVERLNEFIRAYIVEAKAIEDAGKKVEFNKESLPIPEELETAFDQDETFRTAFFALTPGRQRAYIIHFSQAKQSATRHNRIEANKAQILEGVGLHDHYKK